MKFRQRVAIFLAALIVSAGTAFAVSTPASAAPVDCASYEICIWTGANWSGGRYDFWGPDFQGQCVNIGGSFNDVMSSYANHYPGSYVAFYLDANCTGSWRPVVSGGYYSDATVSNLNVGPWGTFLCDNCASSFRVSWD